MAHKKCMTMASLHCGVNGDKTLPNDLGSCVYLFKLHLSFLIKV